MPKGLRAVTDWAVRKSLPSLWSSAASAVIGITVISATTPAAFAEPHFPSLLLLPLFCPPAKHTTPPFCSSTVHHLFTFIFSLPWLFLLGSSIKSCIMIPIGFFPLRYKNSPWSLIKLGIKCHTLLGIAFHFCLQLCLSNYLMNVWFNWTSVNRLTLFKSFSLLESIWLIWHH